MPLQSGFCLEAAISAAVQLVGKVPLHSTRYAQTLLGRGGRGRGGGEGGGLLALLVYCFLMLSTL